MTGIPNNMKAATRLFLVAMILLLAFATISFAQGYRYKVDPWSFGVNGDTQWTVVDPATGLPKDPTGENPNRVSAALARKVDAEFVKAGVKFVIQTGDLTDYAGPGFASRALVAKEDLYDKGIGFFPLRGNHETYGYLIPGYDPLYNLNIPDFLAAFPQTRGSDNTFGATNFSSPAISILNGLSYSFDYGTNSNNARFVIVDTEMTAVTHNVAPIDAKYGQGYFYMPWVIYQYSEPLVGKVAFYDPTKGPRSDYRAWSAVPGTIPANTWFRISGGIPSTNMYGYEEIWPFDAYKAKENDAPGGEKWPGAQQTWISAQLNKATRGTEHAFVLSHRPMINGNHVDSFFGANSFITPADQNAFYASLASNDVKFMISGHDHLYNRALDKSPDGLSQVMQIITQGISTKFYSPTRLDDFGYDGVAPNQTAVKLRETQISQEVNNFGYYIYTVDGPRVTVDYYSDSVGNFVDGDGYPDGTGSLKAPNFNFVKKDTWGYSLNGKQFLVPQGSSYTAVADSFGATAAKILGGTNNSTSTDLTPVGFSTGGAQVSGPRPLNKAVNTGWVPWPSNKGLVLKSDILSLWGMSELGKEQTDKYALSLAISHQNKMQICKEMGIATLNDKGIWVNAVDKNMGSSTKKFVKGPWSSTYGLGTYGINTATGTAWAVLDYNADFAVACVDSALQR